MSSKEHSNESCPRPHPSETPQKALHPSKSPQRVSSQTSPSPKSSKEKLNESCFRPPPTCTPQKALQILKRALYFLKRAPCLQESIQMSRAPTPIRMSHAPTNTWVSRHTKALHLLLQRALYLFNRALHLRHTKALHLRHTKALYLLQRCRAFTEDAGGYLFPVSFQQSPVSSVTRVMSRPQPSEVK